MKPILAVLAILVATCAVVALQYYAGPVPARECTRVGWMPISGSCP